MTPDRAGARITLACEAAWIMLDREAAWITLDREAAGGLPA